MKTPMRGRKRYNPASFKKRVDVQTDSYLPKGAPGMVVCPGCHAISKGKRWRLDEEAYETLRKSGTVKDVVCPACEKIRDGYPSGQVTLKGPYLGRASGGDPADHCQRREAGPGVESSPSDHEPQRRE